MADPGSMRILYMEDDAGLARLIEKALVRAGYEVDIAHDGQQGLAMYESGDYGLLAVDHDMPVRDGLDVIRTLAARGNLPPTIMITGSGNEEIAVEALKLGAGDYLVKDVDGGYLDLLPTVIEKTLNRQHLVVEKLRAQEGLQASESRYRALFEDMPVGLYRTTTDGHFLDANPALVDMLGFPDRESLLGTRVSALYVDPSARGAWQDLMANDEDVTGVELQLRRPDGETIWVRDIARTLQDDRGDSIYEGSLADITLRKRAEDALKEYSDRLEEMVEERTHELRDAQEQLVRREKLAVLGQLAGGVSHELRNPLTVINTAAQVLEMELGASNETVTDYLQMITSEVRTAEKIIFDLLDFSSTQVGERDEASVADLVAEAIEKDPPPDGVRIERDYEPDLPPVMVDARQIGQVLTNLVSNAYQAMPDGGRLAVSARATDHLIGLTVSDTGCGISREHQARLFQPLFTTKANGIGLGLCVVKTLVERNGGQIEVESQEGEGTAFTVWLPTEAEQVNGGQTNHRLPARDHARLG